MAQQKEPHHDICPHCKEEFWNDELSKKEVMNTEVYCEWGVNSNGDVLYGYKCNKGHLWLRVRETMGNRHRHPGFGGSSDYHDINRRHEKPEYRHNLPKEMRRRNE